MDKKQPPDLGNWDLDTSTTDDKINAFDAVADFSRAGIQPAVFLSHSFLQEHPILLEEGCLTVNWDWIPGLYRRTDKLLMVGVTDKQWEKWGRSGGWTAWELDTQPQNFFPNMAMVVCKGAFHDANDPMMQTKVEHYISIARVQDCIRLLPFEQLWEAFNNYTDAATAIGLVQLHHGNTLFPDVYFQFYHYGLAGPDNTVWHGRHVTASGWKAHAMLPPGYVQGATRPIASPTYPYRPCGTGVLGEQPPVHVEDDNEGFKMVDDGDEDTGGKVVVKIPIKDLAKLEGSGLTGADRLFESDDEEDDAELKEQIEAAYKTADTMDELKLSETSSSSNSGSSNSGDDEDDPNVTKQYPEHPEAEGKEESGTGPATTTNPPAVPAHSGPNRILLRRPRAPKGRVRTARNLERLWPPRHNFRPMPREYGSRHKQRSSGVPHWHRRRSWGQKKRLLAVWNITPACSTDSRNWWGSWPMATRMPQRTSGAS